MKKVIILFSVIVLICSLASAETRIYRPDVQFQTFPTTTTTTMPLFAPVSGLTQPFDHALKNSDFESEVTIKNGQAIGFVFPRNNMPDQSGIPFISVIDSIWGPKDEVEIVFKGTTITHPGETQYNTGKLKANVKISLAKHNLFISNRGQLFFVMRIYKLNTDGTKAAAGLDGYPTSYEVPLTMPNTFGVEEHNLDVTTSVPQFPGNFYVEAGFKATVDRSNNIHGGMVCAGYSGIKIDEIDIQQVPK